MTSVARRERIKTWAAALVGNWETRKTQGVSEVKNHEREGIEREEGKRRRDEDWKRARRGLTLNNWVWEGKSQRLWERNWEA